MPDIRSVQNRSPSNEPPFLWCWQNQEDLWIPFQPDTQTRIESTAISGWGYVDFFDLDFGDDSLSLVFESTREGEMPLKGDLETIHNGRITVKRFALDELPSINLQQNN